MPGRRLLNSANAGQCAEFSEYAGHCLLNSANAGQMPAEFSECWAEEVENILRKQ